MVIATTAPARPKVSKFEITYLGLDFSPLAYVVTIRCDDANDVTWGTKVVSLRNAGPSQVITYDSFGLPTESPLVIASGATNAYNAFTNAAGNPDAKKAALLAHLVTVGAIPS